MWFYGLFEKFFYWHVLRDKSKFLVENKKNEMKIYMISKFQTIEQQDNTQMIYF